MKKILIVLTFVTLCCGCCRSREGVETEDQRDKTAHTQLQNGDLIFVGLPFDFSLDNDSTHITKAIASATGDSTNYIHVAIVEVLDDSLWIIDATLKHGVDRYPIDTFLCDFTLNNGQLPLMQVMRLKDTTGIGGFIQNARKHCGSGYNITFLPNRKEQYCSELVRNSYVTLQGDTLFQQSPMNFLSPDGTMPIYWTQLFAQMNMEVPQGVMGTNPNAMSKEKILISVGELHDFYTRKK